MSRTIKQFEERWALQGQRAGGYKVLPAGFTKEDAEADRLHESIPKRWKVVQVYIGRIVQ